MLEILSELDPPLRPLVHSVDGSQIVLLTGDSWAPSLSLLIKNSTSSIEVAAFALSPKWPRLVSAGYDVFSALDNAPSRGVTCRIVFATHKTRSSSGHFNHTAHDKLDEAGWQVRWHPRARLLHAKFFIFDRSIIVLGSHNVSKAAASSNVDMSVAIDSRPVVDEMYTKFNKIWKDSTKAQIR